MINIKSEKPLFTLTVNEYVELNRILFAEAQNNRQNNTHEQDEIMEIKDASELLGLTYPGIYCLTSKKKIPHYKRGKKLYFKRSELIKWLSEGRKKTITELMQE